MSGLPTADPRLYQTGTLAALLAYGVLALDFDVTPARCGLIVAAALATQWFCCRLVQMRFDPLSPLISAGSLCLLLRTNAPLLAVAAAALAVGSKFLVRVRGKHVFNPTDFALVVLLVATNRIWISPGQWGSASWFAFLMACLGGLVITRASRADVTLAFLGAYIALQIGRALSLGDPLLIPLHRIENGGLLLFAFFMISDPKTTPDSRSARVVFAVLCACGAHYVQYRLFRTNGLLWSLAVSSLFVPLLDWCLPGPRYVWPRASAERHATAVALIKDASHAPPTLVRPSRSGLSLGLH
jgi:Na+-transporting NADH:ubiquinone oxidoreductase subunit NqrB